MKRKWLALAAVCAVMISGCGEKERYTYTRTDRIAYPWSQAMMIHAPGMELNTCLAELIAEVEICSDRQTDRYTLSGEVPVTVSWYEARIRDVWYGDAVDDEIQVWFMGDDSQLHKTTALFSMRPTAERKITMFRLMGRPASLF